MVCKNIYALFLISFLFSCGSGSINNSSCNNTGSELVISHGLITDTGEKLAGEVFAKIVPVASSDGKIRISIVPPKENKGFNLNLIEELLAKGYRLRLIACKTNPSSVVSGYSTTGVCSSLGQVNIVGSVELNTTHFKDEGLVVEDKKLHSTASLAYAETNLSEPDFIMLSAGHTYSNPMGDFMVAYGKLPNSKCDNK